MGRPYNLELAEMSQTYDWAIGCSIQELANSIQILRDNPFLSIGSGGSLTVAAYWAMVHEAWTGMPAKHGTPLDLLALPSASKYAIGLVSARGSNPDIVKAFESASLGESDGLVAITFAKGSKLASLRKKFPWVRVVSFRPPVARDGFLATNSLLSFMLLLYRAYAAAAQQKICVPPKLPDPRTTITLAEYPSKTYSILYAGWAVAAAIDLESKFVESGLADVHSADFRNFAHGRHHWLARRGETTTVVALETPQWSDLADKTLAVLPPSTKIIRLQSSNDGPLGAIELVNGGLSLIGQISTQQEFDPGKPTVPVFGRKLYHMTFRPYRKRHIKPSTELLLNRKLGWLRTQKPATAISASKAALARYLDILRTTEFNGIVFDYDETLCPAANRSGCLPTEISMELNQIVEHNVILGIASGRGRSVGQAMRESLPQATWDKVIVGYYNGGHVARLSEGDPPRHGDMASSLTSFVSLLQNHLQLSRICKIEPRPCQITLTPYENIATDSILEAVFELLMSERHPDIFVTHSSHSVDVLGPGVTKLSVVDACIDHFPATDRNVNILRIGDSGRWCGNDFDLLSTPLSLSVAACPINLSWAWNLAPPGHRGPQATLDYINVMQFSENIFSLDIDRLVGRTP